MASDSNRNRNLGTDDIIKRQFRSDSDALAITGAGPDGDITVKPLGNLVDVPWDYVAIDYPTTSSEVYSYKLGGASGTLKLTVTITYSDATKEFITSIAKVAA